MNRHHKLTVVILLSVQEEYLCNKELEDNKLPIVVITGIQSEQQTVQQHVDELEAKFFELCDRARQEVNLSGITLPEFCMLLTQIPASMKDDKVTIRYFQKNIQVFEQCSSVNEIFYHLNLYWDFLNYGLLKQIIDRLEKKQFKQKMEEYIHELTAFCKATTLREFSCAWHHRSTKVPCDLKKLVTKHSKSWMECTLEEVEQFRKKFSVKFSLLEFVLILIRVEKGSVLITWLIPAAVIPHLEYKLQDPSCNLQQFWQDYKVLSLMLDGHQFHLHGSSVASPKNSHDQVNKVREATGFEELLWEGDGQCKLLRFLHNYIRLCTRYVPTCSSNKPTGSM